MLNIDELISKLQASTTDGVTINIINIGDTSDTADDDFDTDSLPYSDDDKVVPIVVDGKTRYIHTSFTVGQRVGVCHIKKDGTGTKHTVGTVDSFGTDDVGDYVRVTGDNGKHYKCGVKLDQERLGSKIFVILDD